MPTMHKLSDLATTFPSCTCLEYPFRTCGQTLQFNSVFGKGPIHIEDDDGHLQVRRPSHICIRMPNCFYTDCSKGNNYQNYVYKHFNVYRLSLYSLCSICTVVAFMWERERECSRICVITSHLIFQTHSTAIWMCQNGWDANKWSHKLTQASPRVNTKSLVHTGKNTHTRSKDYKINGGKVDMICGLSVCIQHIQSNQMIWMVYCAFVLYYLWFDCSLCERLTDIKRLRWFKWYENKKNCQRR